MDTSLTLFSMGTVLSNTMLAVFLASVMCISLCACSMSTGGTGESTTAAASVEKTDDMKAIEEALDLSAMDAEWTCDESGDSWTLSIVTAVTNPEIEDEQGVSVCVPAAYVKGVDTDGDGKADAESGTSKGNLVIDYDTSVTSTNGQTYTAASAPVIVNTGAAGYSEQENQTAASTYAAEGYINVACGNRGKQSTLSDGTYTGDAPSCLVDQKNAVRFVKYNILLGNLPGSVDYFVSTGGSGGGAHASMLAATSDHPDFYDYEIEAGAVGVYKDADGNYITSVTVDGNEVSLPLYVDMMYGEYVDGAAKVAKAAATGQTANGTAEEADGTDISGWVTYDEDKGASFSLADIAAYRTAGASKAIPGFDVMDYGQEDYVFGSSTADARHWSRSVLDIFETNQDALADLFN